MDLALNKNQTFSKKVTNQQIQGQHHTAMGRGRKLTFGRMGRTTRLLTKRLQTVKPGAKPYSTREGTGV